MSRTPPLRIAAAMEPVGPMSLQPPILPKAIGSIRGSRPVAFRFMAEDRVSIDRLKPLNWHAACSSKDGASRATSAGAHHGADKGYNVEIDFPAIF